MFGNDFQSDAFFPNQKERMSSVGATGIDCPSVSTPKPEQTAYSASKFENFTESTDF